MANTSYRVTPLKRKKGKVYIVQRVADRKQIGKSFGLKSEAAAYELELLAKAPQANGKIATKTILQAYKGFAVWKKDDAQGESGTTKHSARWYGTDYRLRISKFMPDVLLSEFDQLVIEEYLDTLLEAKVPYKTMKRSVAGIKTFLKRMAVERENPRLDLLQFSIAKHYKRVVPKNDDLVHEPEVQMLKDEEVKNILNLYYKEAPTNPESAYTFALLGIFFQFGLRLSEVLGLHKANVDFENNLLHVKGSIVDGKYLNKTKNKASRGTKEMDKNAIKFFDWWLGYLDHHKKHSIFILPGVHRFDLEGKAVYKPNGQGKPICPKTARNLVWKAYARMGLAEIEIPRDGHVRVIKSDFKGFPTRTFRHKFCNSLFNAMNSNPLLTANYCKQSSGHDQFKTFSERYGNKPVRGTADERAARADAKRKALNTDIIPNTKLITK